MIRLCSAWELPGLLAEWDARNTADLFTDSALTTPITPGTTNNVGGWRSSRINTWAAVQATGTFRPTWSPDAFGNGRPGVSFNGVDQWLRYASGVTYAMPMTYFYVLATTEVGAARIAIDGSAVGPTRHRLTQNANAAWALFATSSVSMQPSNVAANEIYVVAGVFQAGEAELWVNGLRCVSGTLTSQNFTPVTFGTTNAASPSTNFFKGPIGYYSMYQGQLVENQIKARSRTLMKEWRGY